MIEKTTYTNENTPTYAERVTSQYDRISMLLGKDKAHFFNEFIRGASLLDENEHGFLSKVETVSDDELYIFIEEFEESYKKFMDQFKATSLYNTFEKILETGRTKIFIWRDGEYQQIDIDENDQKILPWAGEIHVGGPKPSMIGIVGIAKDYNIVFGQNNIVINEHKFE